MESNSENRSNSHFSMNRRNSLDNELEELGKEEDKVAAPHPTEQSEDDKSPEVINDEKEGTINGGIISTPLKHQS